MKAAVYTKYGPPEVVHIKEVQKPHPGSKEVLIKVQATTVNRTDCGFRSAEYFISRFFSGLFKPKYPVLGNEFAGVVEAVGEDVINFLPGDKVFGYNDTTFGAHAEYLVVTEDGAIASIPEGLPFALAAPITEGAHYALNIIRAAKITSGQQILVNGATGAIGSAAVQLIKAIGAEVTAVCDTPNIKLVQSLGADIVIDYTKQDFIKLSNTYDVVFDAVGKSSFNKCRSILKKKGIYVSTELGYMAQNPLLGLISPVVSGKKVLFPIPTISKQDILFLKGLVEQGKYKPVIDRHYLLVEIVEAYEYVETGMKTGNVIINIPDQRDDDPV